MSIIAIKGIPFKCGLGPAVQMYRKQIGGPFEPLNFSTKTSSYGTKTLYLRLSEKMDPIQVVDRINSPNNKSKGVVAFVPEHVPDLPLSTKFVKTKKDKKNKIPNATQPHRVVVEAHYQLFQEIQYKFPGLFQLSLKTKHKLLDEIADVIAERLKTVIGKGKQMNCFEMTGAYRKSHPHFGDFQLILSTLHRLQDAAGAPRLQIQEAELASNNNETAAEEKIPRTHLQAAYNQYAQKASHAVADHIRSLDTNPSPDDDEETVARKKVRGELKKMLPYLSVTMLQIAEQHFAPPQEPHLRIRIYGEPFLPNRDAMSPFTQKYAARGTGVTRVQNMYNLLRLHVDRDHYVAVKAMDGTVVSGAKLVIRDSDMPLRSPPVSVRSSLAAYCGGELDRDFCYDDGDDEEQQVADDEQQVPDDEFMESFDE